MGRWLTVRVAYNLLACSGILCNHKSPLRPVRFVTQKIVTAACRIAAGSREKLQMGNIAIQRDWGWAPEYGEAMWRMVQQEHPDDFVIATGEGRSFGGVGGDGFVAARFGLAQACGHRPGFVSAHRNCHKPGQSPEIPGDLWMAAQI